MYAISRIGRMRQLIFENTASVGDRAEGGVGRAAVVALEVMGLSPVER
jgi:hypothetical protein